METTRCKIIGAIAIPIASTRKPSAPKRTIKSYQKPLKTKIGPILFNAYKNKKTK